MKSTEKISATVYGVTYTAVKYKYMHFLLYVFYIKKIYIHKATDKAEWRSNQTESVCQLMKIHTLDIFKNAFFNIQFIT